MALWLAAAAVGGGLIQANAARSQARAEAKALLEEARVQRKNALIAREVGAYNASRQQTASTQQLGTVVADYASSGISLDSGSVLDVLRQSTVNAELDRQSIIHGAEIDAVNSLNRAAAATSGARNAIKAGKQNAFNSLFQSGLQAASFTGGGSKASSPSATTTSGSGSTRGPL